MKKVIPPASSSNPITYTWYLRDASGNIMATETHDGTPHFESNPLALNIEYPLYGSSRIGVKNYELLIQETQADDNTYYLIDDNVIENAFTRTLNLKNYELNNHLGNVLVTVSDKKIGHDDGFGAFAYYTADVTSAQDYYPFGMIMPGRSFSSPTYRYGFNGKEKDDEAKGNGNSLDFGARIYDSRIGRWLSVDPLVAKYPSYSSYNFALNSPLIYQDHDGKEPARNQAGTIQAAIQQWRDAGLKTMTEIRRFVTTKSNDVMAIRYVYTEDRGWIDLQHYFGVQTYGKLPMNLLEPASGVKFLQDHVFGDGADKSYYSYEDLPTNQFSSEKNHTTTYEYPTLYGPGLPESTVTVEKKGEDLFNSVEDHFESAGATNPENAPNWEKIPMDDQDRSRLPKNATTLDKESGKYIPQNRSPKPMDLKNFKAAPTSIERIYDVRPPNKEDVSNKKNIG